MPTSHAHDAAMGLLVFTGVLLYFRRDTGLPNWAITLIVMTAIVGATVISLVAP